jgi:hypothetical protein
MSGIFDMSDPDDLDLVRARCVSEQNDDAVAAVVVAAPALIARVE